MVYTLQVAIAAAGTRQALSATRKAATWVNVQAAPGNSGNIFVGDVTVAAAKPGVTLTPGSSFMFPAQGVTSPYDLQHIYVDTATNGNKADVNYFLR